MKGAASRIALVLALACGVGFGAAVPALAKGPVHATIQGPDLASPITLRSGENLANLDNMSGLATGLWKWGCKEYFGCVRRPSGELGPSYKVTYTLLTHEKVVQYVYPFAALGPMAYVPAGQRFFGGQRAVGGWFKADRGLRPLLQDVGVPLPAIPSVSPATGASPEGKGRPISAILAFVLVFVVGGVLIAGIVVRHRRLDAEHTVQDRVGRLQGT